MLRAARGARGSAYQIDPAMSTRSLVMVAGLRAWALIRGMIWTLRIRRSQLPLFVGRGATVRHAHLLELGRGASIGDFAIIDALSLEGVRVGDRATIAEFAYLKCTGVLGKLGVGDRDR